jgi:hypothetical protein
VKKTMIASHMSPNAISQWKTVVFTLMVGWWVWYFQPLSSVDRLWSDIRLVCREHPAEPEIVVVQITAADVLENGLDRLDRRFIARTYEKFADYGVRRVLSDVNLNAKLSTEEHVALQAAMQRLGTKRLATGYEPNQQLRGRDDLLRFATMVDLRMIAGADARFRGYVYPMDSDAIDPIAWLAFGEHTQGVTDFDLRVNPSSFTTYTVSELHQPEFVGDNLRDKLVIFAMDESVNRTRVFLPISGESNRGILLAMATQAKLAGYERQLAIGDLVLLIQVCSSVLAGLLIGLSSTGIRRAILWVFCGRRGFDVCGLVYGRVEWDSSPTGTHVDFDLELSVFGASISYETAPAVMGVHVR